MEIHMKIKRVLIQTVLNNLFLGTKSELMKTKFAF